MNTYTKFQISFHSFIAIFTILIAIAYMFNGFEIAYVALASILAINSLSNLFKLTRKTNTEEIQN